MRKNNSGGIGFTGLLTIAFIVLKLTGVISWPWIWVLSPIWITVLIIVCLAIIEALAEIVGERRSNNEL